MLRHTVVFALVAQLSLLAQPPAQPVAEWESRLQRDPEQIDVRTRLIREYFRLSRQDPAAGKARTGHVLWLVTHHPEAPVLAEPAATISEPGQAYNSISRAWQADIAKPVVTPQVLANAANFFRSREPQRSIELLQKARALEPKNYLWTGMLGDMLAMQLAGVTALNQNGLPVGADPSKMDSPEAARIKAMLLASKDTDLIAAAAGGLEMRGGIAASMIGRGAEVAALAEQLLRRGASLEPQSPRFHWMLAQYRAQRAERASGDERKAYLRDAMTEFDAATKINPESATACPPSAYARVAVEAGRLDSAEAAARRCLAQSAKAALRDTGIHESNLILGRVALRRGDMKAAGNYLLTAARIHGDGALTSFGPNMMLARELLEKGERDVVLQYFRMCAVFWSYDRGQLARWTQEVEAGRIPEFGANLVY